MLVYSSTVGLQPYCLYTNDKGTAWSCIHPHIKLYSLWHKSLVSSSPFGQSANPSHILVRLIGSPAPV